MAMMRNAQFAQFLMHYLDQLECLLNLIDACQNGDWLRCLNTMEAEMKYYFAHDLLNYACFITVHIAQMRALETEDSQTWEALKSGNFVVAKTHIPSTRLFTDQGLEQKEWWV